MAQTDPGPVPWEPGSATLGGNGPRAPNPLVPPRPHPIVMTSFFAVGMPGGMELFWILLVVLVLFGGAKLPQLARSMGSSITQFKKGLKDDEAPPGLEKENGDSA